MSTSDNELDEFQEQPVSLVIFHGPPCTGKTHFYRTFYLKTHARFSIADWLKESTKNSVHTGIRKVIRKLKDGDSVVLDDCNISQEGRASLIKSVLANVPQCQLIGVDFKPLGGLSQINCSLEMQLANQLEVLENKRKNSITDLDSSESDIPSSESEESSFSDYDDLANNNDKLAIPEVKKSAFEQEVESMAISIWKTGSPRLSYDEGFKLIQFVDQKFWIPGFESPSSLDLKFAERSLLVVDARSIFNFKHIEDTDFDYKLDTNPNAASTITEWMIAHENSNVVIYIDEATLFPTKIELQVEFPDLQSMMIGNCQTQIKQALLDLKIKIPIHFIQLNYENNVYQMGPSLESIAFLVRRHNVYDISRILWVTTDENINSNINNTPPGVHYIKGSEFFNKSGFDIFSKIRMKSHSSPTKLPSFYSSSPLLEHFITDTNLEQSKYAIKSSPKKEEVKTQKESTDNPTIDTLEEGINEDETESKKNISIIQSPLQAYIEGIRSEWTYVFEIISIGRIHGAIFPPSKHLNRKRMRQVEQSPIQIEDNSQHYLPHQISDTKTVIELTDSQETSPHPIKKQKIKDNEDDSLIDLT